MPPAKKRPGDLTGVLKERLEKERAEEMKARAGEITMITAQIAEEKAEVIDLTQERTPAIEHTAEVEVENPTRKILVREDIDQMTFGRDNTYNFEAGRTYVVPRALADHLREKGYVWD